MRIGLVCGDGVPASGLLTIFRNVVGLGVDLKLFDTPVSADLGYSWRPDKPAFFPYGPAEQESSALLEPAPHTPPFFEDPDLAAAEWTSIRTSVAQGTALGPAERVRLHERIDRLAVHYRNHFSKWMRHHQAPPGRERRSDTVTLETARTHRHSRPRPVAGVGVGTGR
ncbi:hypothetical protein [Streptomyces sp. NPDC018045]|uniref:hypothetical protein n=1 Tax=Streptomyces sp. NPDC018045 TaxID=3365037 RepID=UPI0037A3F522